ncbi:AEC family transporter [uncultured Prevotella sp.]|uniref:AEC family transporter n=1 Tax=uncultured Prevotella sp. TaxID=159272 RepID=UPI00261F9461|nr:AEC family transporter [uncultured Prevotella sp.]
MENLQVMVVLFIIVVLGYALCKLGYMGEDFDRKLSSIVVDVTCPLLILSSVMGESLPDRTLILPLLGVGFLTYVLLLVFGFFVPRLIAADRDDQGMIGFALMFANVGFIGYPIVSSIFGAKAVFYAALLNMPNTFFIFTAGVMLVKCEYSVRKLNLKLLFSPAMIAAFVAALLVALDVHTPEIVARPVTMVGNITVPAALMIIGSSMARLPLHDIIGSPKVYVASVVRLGVVPVSLYFLFKVCGVSDIVNEINTVVIAMPVASFGTMFCMKYGRNPALMTEMTFITTVGSIFTIPLITMLFC